MADRLKYDTLEYADSLNIPVLMLAGKDDTVCPINHQKYLVDALKQCEFHIIEGAGHTFREKKHLNELITIFQQWLNTHT